MENIHQGQPVITFGAENQDARLAVILLHGRGSNAESMLPLAESLRMEGVRFLIPQAAHNRWYPHTAFGPFELNEPDLSSAMGLIDALVQQQLRDGLSNQQIVLGGFSQGACLASEYFVRNADGYGALFVLSGALIGPPGTPREYSGSFNRMPVFIGGSDIDPWIPYALLGETARVFERMGADVDYRTYPGMAHTVNQDEIDRVRAILENAIQLGEGAGAG
jgi:predicted esterase